VHLLHYLCHCPSSFTSHLCSYFVPSTFCAPEQLYKLETSCFLPQNSVSQPQSHPLQPLHSLRVFCVCFPCIASHRHIITYFKNERTLCMTHKSVLCTIIFTRIDRHTRPTVFDTPVLDLDDLGLYLCIKLREMGKKLVALCAMIFTRIDRHRCTLQKKNTQLFVTHLLWT